MAIPDILYVARQCVNTDEYKGVYKIDRHIPLKGIHNYLQKGNVFGRRDIPLLILIYNSKNKRCVLHFLSSTSICSKKCISDIPRSICNRSCLASAIGQWGKGWRCLWRQLFSMRCQPRLQLQKAMQWKIGVLANEIQQSPHTRDSDSITAKHVILLKDYSWKWSESSVWTQLQQKRRDWVWNKNIRCR